MKALIVSGSPRTDESLTNVLANVIKDASNKAGLEAELWLIGERPLPLFKPEFQAESAAKTNPKSILNLASAVERSDIITLVTPVYHGSYTSHLKNALDCLYSNSFSGKTIVLATQGNPATAGIALSHLSDVARTLQGAVYNSYIVVDRQAVDTKTKAITNVQSTQRILQIFESLAISK